MKLLRRNWIASGLLPFALATSVEATPVSLKLLTQSGYLPTQAVLVRVEARDATGQPDRDLWNAEVALSADGSVVLSTNRVTLRNGLGSVLVTCSGGGNFNLTGTLGSLTTSRPLQTFAGTPVTSVSGTLVGSATTWSNVVAVTGNLTVPAGHTLTIQSNTLVLVNGVSSGTAGIRININGTINSLGTELHPVTITCSDAALRWGQIRHDNAQPSLYRHTSITRAGRAPGEGHTGQAPVLRPNNSTIVFENCNITDHADASGTPGKIGYGINANLTFRDCHFARARMGPEIQGSSLLCSNTWILDMRGPDDGDGIYLHDQQAGQEILLTGCVLAGGDDDGIDTLGAIVTVENSILRDWNSVIEDAKAISVFNGATHIRRCLITDSTVGVAAKWSGGAATLVTINNSTIAGNQTNVLAQFKANAPGPFIDYRITNSILWGGDAVQSDFGQTNFTIAYCDVSEPWPGTGNINSDPLFADFAARNFHLLAGSPAIDSGNPGSPTDPDSSRADMGVYPFDAASANGLFVSLTAPSTGAAFTGPTNVQLQASANSTTGVVAKVEFYQSATRLGEATSSPFSFAWNNVAPGFYSLAAVASDTTGFTRTSAPVNITVNASGAPTTNSFVPLGSTWAYLDNGTDQGTNWSQPGFNVASWSNGIAPLGYCGTSCAYSIATPVGFGPNSTAKFITTYFRRSFNVDDTTRVQELILTLLRDDGAAVYINGKEVHRIGMGDGVITNQTPASTAANYQSAQSSLPPQALAALVNGPNVLAVEVHQNNGTSSDIVMEAELRGIIAASTNLPPIVSLTAPANGATLAAPANVTLTALASDNETSVTNVAFFSNGSRLANDSSAPYSFAWNNVAAGNYSLTAVATDSTGLSSTSSVVNVVVSTNTAAPVVFSKSPAPGNLTSLTQLSVTFSKVVVGINASDLLVNGTPASSVSGSGSNYTFTFSQPAYGTVLITWAVSHGIADAFTPPATFDRVGPGATWQYQLLDSVPPVVAAIDPVPSSTIAALTSITLSFNEPVAGVDASDLRINAAPTTTLSGSGAGPYTFGFAQPPIGPVQLGWASGHGIQDISGNAFAGGAWSYTLDTNSTGVILSEIMYHPASENVLEEYIELFNKGAAAVDLTGWRFSAGVQFTFPSVSIPAGSYLVVAADVPTFLAKYPGVGNVVGGWTGFLNNSSEDIDLDDSFGNRVDSVEYADEGDWGVRQRGPLALGGRRGWTWFKESDGLGKSLELLNPNLSNNAGQNWAASRVTNGTPGTANSLLTNNLPPMILGTSHLPIVPKSSEPVVVTARIVDESAGGIAVSLSYRPDGPTPPLFTTNAMRDDGLGGDAAASDGLFSAIIPVQPNNTVVEFFIIATDQQGATRTWPAPAIAATDGAGPTGQVVNALYQVDDTPYNPTNNQPLYKMILTEAERAELAAIPSQSNAQGPNSQMNGTFISMDGGGTELHYLVGIRNRGHGSRTASPPNYRINYRSDDAWKGVSGINLNAINPYIQHFGSAVARKAGAAGGASVAVQVRVNNQNRATSGSGGQRMYGSYAANEVLDSEWAANHFPTDGEGNVYKAIRDQPPTPDPRFDYRGENPNSYTNTYFKESNVSENDFSDIVGMLRVMGVNNTTSFTTENVRPVVNVEQWLRHLAVMNLMGNAESGLNTGNNDDYYMYRGVTDPRFILAYHDLDQVLGITSMASNSDIFRATCCPVSGDSEGTWRSMDRFMHWPDFEPIYFRLLKELLETTFSQPQFDALVDQTLGGYVDSSAMTAMKTWMNGRRTYVLGLPQVQSATNMPVAIATISDVPRSPTPFNTATLRVGGNGVVAYRYQLNGGGYGAETPVATSINLSGLPNGTNTVSVIAKNSNGVWQPEVSATVRAWVVNPAWPAVRLSEVLARNDSAVNHFGTFPDLIELLNESGSPIDLSGLRLTDELSSPSKFTFPPGTTLPAGNRLVVYANNPDGTSGLHLSFSLDQDGEGVYLLDRIANGNIVLDSVSFGFQLPNLSIGRLASGDWMLTQPTFGSANVAQPIGNPRNLKINEWLALGISPNPDDFIELFNPDSLPVALGGLHLTDHPIGAPAFHRIASHSFIAAGGYSVFIADGNPSDGANHLSFGLALEQGEIGLTDANASLIDCVIYGPQQAGVSSGRCPDGAVSIKLLVTATPGSPNGCPFVAPPPTTVNLIPMTNVWRFEESNTDLGTNWVATDFNDLTWLEGPALLGFDVDALPEPIRTPLTVANGKITFYFRTHFTVPADLNVTSLEANHLIDDGAVFYLNGKEAGRFNMQPAPTVITNKSLAQSHEGNVYEVTALATTNLVAGDNVLAVEVHQSSAGSSDIVFGLRLNALSVTNSPTLAGVLINEVLANNATLEEVDGSKPDWVEIYNPSSNAVDIAGMSLTDSTLVPQRWIFPAPSILPALGFLKVRLDPDLPSSNTNAGFGLKANGGAVYLINRPADGGAPASSVTYGLQAADFSLGRIPNGGTNWVLTVPTLGSGNLAASLGDPLQLKVNEWMAAPASGDDWFELFNPNAQPVNVSQLWVSDSVSSPKYRLPDRSFIGAGSEGFLRLWAANGTDADFTGFSLNAGSDGVALFSSGQVFLHGFTWSTAQQSGVSEGLLPDGTANRVFFPTTATPGNPNFLPLGTIVINELISHSDPPLEDAVEFYNPTGDDVDISGWYLSDSQNNLLKYRLPAGTVVPAGGFKVLYEYQFNGETAGTPFSFSSAKGDNVYLSQSITPGVLTGYRAFAEFGASENGVSFGRYRTSIGTDFTALSARTFGVDNPATTNQFRTGNGKTNAYPKVGPVVINEIMYNYPGDTNDVLEFVELHNILGSPVSLFDPANPNNTWRLRKGVDFNFPPDTTIPAGGFLVVVNFDPQTAPATLATFRATYGTNMTLLGPYGGKLDNGGEAIEVQKPDAPQTVPGPDFGLVPYVVVDRIVYDDVAPWPTTADGGGHSLRRLSASLYGNDPVNWIGGSPNPGSPNISGGTTNTAPVLAAIGNKAAIEGVLLSFAVSATDSDVPSQSLTFSLDSGAPAGASITPAGAFTWAPSEVQGPGVYPITIRVTDSGSPLLSDFETIQISVAETNDAPILAPIGNKAGNEGTLITFSATANDTDVPTQTLTFTLDAGAPAGASLSASGTFTWTPTENDGPGVYPVTVRVTDSGSPTRSDFETLQITVNELNAAPVLAAIGNKTVNEGSLLTFTATATDSDLPAQSYAFSLDAGAPLGASITGAGVFTWTPHETNGPGVINITVRVTDNGSPAQTDFEIVAVTVNEVNAAPVLAAIGNKSVVEGNLLTFNATATDEDRPAQILTYSLDAGAPAGATLSSNGVFNWTPTAAQGPSNYTVTVRVADDGSPARDDFETISINVSEAPVLITVLNYTNAWRYLATGTNLLTAWRETNYNDSAWPSAKGVFFNETTASTVIPAPTNTFLPLTGPGGRFITNYYFRTRFFLPAEAAGVSLVASNVLDDGAVIYINGVEAQRLNMNTGLVLATSFSAASWEANTTFVTNVSTASLVMGENEIAVEVHQQNATSSDVVFGLSLTALIPPQTPVAITQQPANVSITEGATAQFSVTASGSSPFYQWQKNGSPILGANRATFSITNAQTADAGNYSVIVSNLVNSVTSSNATLAVGSAVNLPPVLGAIGNKTVNESALLTFTATATDPQSPPQNLIFTLDPGAPFGASITPAGVFTWTPHETNGPGVFSITLRVTDNGSPALTDFETITVTVSEVNRAPTLAAIGNRIVNEGVLLSFTATATDLDLPAQSLSFSLDAGAPSGASITSGGLFTWTPAETNGPEVYNITIRVTDDGASALTDFETITVTVNEVNRPPVLAPIGPRTVNEGSLITFTASATDPDFPAQQLTFSLDPGSPAGASFNPATRIFAWTPAVGHTPATNLVTVRVTDNGSPATNDFETVAIIVLGPPRITSITVAAGSVTLQWSSFSNKTYRVEYRSLLSSGAWEPLGSNVPASGATTSITDPVGGNSQRFYRVIRID